MKQIITILLALLPAILLSQNYGTLTMEDGLMDNAITCIYQDKSGITYIGTFRGIDRFDGQQIVNIPFEENGDKELNRITAITSEDAEHLLVGNATGLFRLNKRLLTLNRIFQKDIDCMVTAIKKLPHGKKIEIDTQFGVYCLKNGQLHKTSNRHCRMMTQWRQPTSRWGRFNTANVIYRSPYDHTEWNGYNFFGLDYQYMNRGIFHVLDTPKMVGDRPLAIRSFLLDGSQTLLGTFDGLWSYSTKDHKLTRPAPSLDNIVVTSLLRSGSHYLIATIGRGMEILNASSFSSEGIFLKGANVYQLMQDHKGQIWISSSQGLGCYDTKSKHLKIYSTLNSQIPSNEVFCSGISSTGIIWVSTAGGLCQYRPDIHAITVTNLSNKVKELGPMRSIEPIPNGHMLFIPQHGLPKVYESVSDKMYTVPLQLESSNDALLFVKIINSNTYIFATSNGIFTQQKGVIRKFGYIDGLPNQQLQSHAILIDSKGWLWAATNGGLVYARIKDMLHRHFKHHDIILTQIQTDHWFSHKETTGVMLDKELHLSRYRSEFTTQFAPLIYGKTNDLHYRYRLKSHGDEEWQEAGHDHIISYRHLWPGTYHLQIAAVGMPEISTEITVIVPVTWKAIMFILSFILLLIFAGYIVYCKHTKTPYFWKQWEKKPVKYQHSQLSSSDARTLQKKLLKIMEEDRPYLNANLQMYDLAKAVGCTTHELSQLLSQYMQRNYYDLIAEYRINEFKRRAQQPKYDKYTITALSELCGFKSRTPFLTAFKRFTGITPKEFMDSVRKK